MLRTSPAGRFTARWYRWAAITVVLAGAALWAVTGSWQWMVTTVSVVICAPNLYYSMTREDLVRAALSIERLRGSLPTIRAERLADGFGLLVLAVSINYALWVGPWWWGAVGVGVSIAVGYATTLTADIRLERRLARARSRFAEADVFGADDRSDEAAAVLDQIIAELGDDPSQRTRDLVALALSNKALYLGRANKRREAFEVYLHLIDEYSDDPTPEVQKVVKQAGDLVGKEI